MSDEKPQPVVVKTRTPDAFGGVVSVEIGRGWYYPKSRTLHLDLVAQPIDGRLLVELPDVTS